MVAAAATTRGNSPAGASANAWCRAAIRSAVDGEPGWFRSAISRATELNTVAGEQQVRRPRGVGGGEAARQ